MAVVGRGAISLGSAAIRADDSCRPKSRSPNVVIVRVGD
jgi:hypothetical protein